MNNVLNAYNYELLCDFSIDHNDGKYFADEMILEDSTIFCKTDFIDELFDNVRLSKKNHILLTHHSDIKIDEETFNKKPKSIKKWFGINVDFNDNDLIPIPIGLRTHEGIYHDKNNSIVIDFNEYKNNKKQNIMYCNWRNTNSDRNNIIDKMDSNILYKDTILPYNIYLNNMSKCKYVLCPPGNGLDTHRFWEALYVGSIPVVLKTSFYEKWGDVPIIQIDNYEDITIKLLEDNARLINDNYVNILNITYWRDMINDHK